MNQSSTTEKRLCTVCNGEISEARVRAISGVSTCRSCLEEAGDVAPIRRYDETIGEEKVSIFFKKPSYYLEAAINQKLNRIYSVPTENYA